MDVRLQQSMGQCKRRFAVVGAGALVAVMVVAAGPAEAKRTSGTGGADRLKGTSNADTIKARGGKDNVSGGGGDDRLYGGAGNDRVSGAGGKDRVYGGAGADRLYGGRGDDRLYGGAGRDRLSGGRGADHLSAVDGKRDRLIKGGPGVDHCRIDPADKVNVRGCEIVTVVKAKKPGAPTKPSGLLVCVAPPEALRARAALDDPALTFSSAFYSITTTITASADGLNGEELPISIDDVCDVPKSLAAEAAQLVGGDGVAIITASTAVYDATGQRLTGAAATTAVGEADTVVIRAKLRSPAGWKQNEDGAPVPTFSVSRADIPD